MPFKQTDLEWNKADAKPPQDAINNGFSPREKPPASFFNWLFNRTAVAVKDLVANAIHKEDKGVANGVAGLDANGRVPATQLPGSNATNSDSTETLATSRAVKAAYDFAASKTALTPQQIAAWDAKETTIGAQAKATKAKEDAVAYTQSAVNGLSESIAGQGYVKSATVKNILVGTTEPTNSQGVDGDLYFVYKA
jgi:hypothetical protein